MSEESSSIVKFLFDSRARWKERLMGKGTLVEQRVLRGNRLSIAINHTLMRAGAFRPAKAKR